MLFRDTVMTSASQLKNSGFSLVELVFTVAVAAILLGLAMPSLREFNQNSNAASQSNQMVGDMGLARMEAVKNGSTVRVSAVGGVWENGWVVATDRDRNGALNGPDKVLKETGAAIEGFDWVVSTDDGSTAVTNVFFDSNGYLTQTNKALMFQLLTPDRSPQKCKRVAVSLSGRAESRKGKNNPCN